MSEYQYYEFVAIDRGLTGEQQDELRAVSTRGRISSTSFVNEYEWGDLKADPRVWMERYFDAHLYLANWGTHRIALRLPRGAVEPAAVARYCVGDSAVSWGTRTHVIVDLHSEDEDGVGDWVDPDGWLAAIAPVRTELVEGDLRPLYLAWLLAVQNRELGDDEPEPPVPAGLGKLSGAQQALAEFLRLDPDLLAAAAEASEPLTVKGPSAAALGRWVKALPAADKDDLLLRVLRGDGGLVRSEMLRQFRGAIAEPSADGGRTAGELLAAGEKAWASRQEVARKREAAERRRQEREAVAAQARRLDAVARNADTAWKQVDAFIGVKRAKEYDTAVALLRDLHAVAVRDDAVAEFTRRMVGLREQHRRLPSLIDRLDRARLP